MIRIHTNEQGSLVIFALCPEDRRKFGPLGVPHQMALSIDAEPGVRPLEATATRWLLIAEMLTGLTEAEVETEGFTVARYPYGEADVVPLPLGVDYLRYSGASQ